MHRLLILLVVGLVGVATPAQAEPQPGGKRLALVIGNGAYRNVDRLPNAASDARLVAATLQALGFTLVGDGPQLNLDRAHLAQAVQDFGRALVGAEVGLFYYSGHGLQVEGVNWLVPVDANPSRPQDLNFQMVDADLVLRQMDGAGAKLNLVLLDACRNNPFATRGFRSMTGGMAEMRAPEGTLISYATQPGSVAADGAGANSPYTTALVDGMRQPGMDVFRMFNRVGLQVRRATGGSQQPWVSSSPIDGDFYFTEASANQASSAPPVQVAGLARPPDLLAPNATAPGPPSPTMPADPMARVLAIARAQRCSILDAQAVGGSIAFRGVTLPGPSWNGLLQQTGVSRGLRIDNGQVEFVPPFARDAVDVLGAVVRSTIETGSGRLMMLSQRVVVAGGKIVVTLRSAAGMAVVLDLFLPDGTVQHGQGRTLATAAGDAQLSFDIPDGSPPGKRLMTALVSKAPLDIAVRPHSERASSYLPALRQALEGMAEAQAALAPFEVRPAAQPVYTASRPPVKGPRCSAVLERAQLGEALSDADRAYLRAECR